MGSKGKNVCARLTSVNRLDRFPARISTGERRFEGYKFRILLLLRPDTNRHVRQLRIIVAMAVALISGSSDFSVAVAFRIRSEIRRGCWRERGEERERERDYCDSLGGGCNVTSIRGSRM